MPQMQSSSSIKTHSGCIGVLGGITMKHVAIEMIFADFVNVTCPKCNQGEQFEDINSKMFDLFLVFHYQTCNATKFIVSQEVEIDELSND